ncbi:YciI family protein [Microbacterium fluvii]|uniref:YciI family protein n=1 Tax=Microbacterium fluvii TaxID=415215 RepID=A0ABW2HH13_9MICO|nr:YciI family protein [Microbacterium fluvii]MCU4673441.1 YciI family protein [Microbacterium fluvii]
MRFLMLVLSDPELTDPAAEPAPVTIEEWSAEVYDTGRGIEGDRLRPPAEAKTVRRRKGEVIVSDGPFAESYELIGGFDVLECADLEEAVEIASRHPMAAWGAIELRAYWPLDL